MISRILLSRYLCFVFLLIFSSAKTFAQNPQLIIGMELNYPPFEMTDTQGNPSGVSIDLAHSLATYLHRDLQIENIPFKGLIPALKTGRIDLIISSMTATDERRKSIDFSDPYLSTGLAILVQKESLIQSINDVDQPKMNVVVRSGTTSDTYAHQHFHSAHVLYLDTDSACALEIIQGKADAFIYDQMSIFQFAKKHPDTTRALLNPFQKESWAIGIRLGNSELKKQVNSFLADFKAKKGFDALGDKYLKEDKEAFRQMGFPFYF